MPTVETTITVDTPEGRARLNQVDERVAEALQGAGRELLAAASRALEEKALGS
jgi:hypothetical protein